MRGLICVVADENYAAPATTLVRSIGANWASMDRPSVRILGPAWSARARLRLSRQAERAGCTLSFFVASADASLPIAGHWNTSVYSRLRLGEACDDAERVICLDSDKVVLASLHELLTVNLEGAILGAVKDLCLTAKRGCASPYFNAGLLVVDTGLWIRERMGEQCRELLLRPGADLPYLDQDALNHVVRGRWLQLDSRWNVFHFDELKRDEDFPSDLLSDEATTRLNRLQRDAWSLHFVGPNKPWLSDYPEGRNRDRYLAHCGRRMQTGSR